MIERKLIQGVPGGVDYTEPQCGEKVHEFSYCQRFEAKKAKEFELPIHESCYYCRFATFDINDPNYADMGCCCYPDVKR